MVKTQLEHGKYLLWVLEQIDEVSKATGSDEIEYNLDELAKYSNAPSSSIQRKTIYRLQSDGIIQILREIPGTLTDGISVKSEITTRPGATSTKT